MDQKYENVKTFIHGSSQNTFQNVSKLPSGWFHIVYNASSWTFFILGLKLEAIEGVFFNKNVNCFIKENECGLDIKIFKSALFLLKMMIQITLRPY